MGHIMGNLVALLQRWSVEASHSQSDVVATLHLIGTINKGIDDDDDDADDAVDVDALPVVVVVRGTAQAFAVYYIYTYYVAMYI